MARDTLARTLKPIICAVALFMLFLPFVQANGGVIKLAENNHLISASLAPISPSVGEKQTILISFVHNFSLIREGVQANVSVKKNGKTISFQTKSFSGGVESFEAIYPEEGIYEVFVTFEKESELGKVYAPEDFLVQAKNGGACGFGPVELLIAGAIALAAGFAIGRRLK